ncbi:MAG: DUF3419 family protein [Pseudomonadota bacterium]
MTDAPDVGAQLDAAVTQNAAFSKTGLLERTFARLFHGLVYAQIWEDPVVDMAALDLGPKDHVVCIASGSCNLLSYLAVSPASITAVDLSPAHVMLGKLKLATVRTAPDHHTLYNMLGKANMYGNIKTFDEIIAADLDPEVRDYWNTWTPTGRRINMFARGLHRHGLLGRFLGVIRFVSMIARVDYKPLLEARTLDEQAAFFEANIVPLYNSRIIRWIANQRASLFGLGIPPAQYDKLAADADGDIVAVLEERTRKLVCDFPVKENYFLWQATTRGYDRSADAAVPPYLEPQHFETVKANADRVTLVNRSLTDVLAEVPAGSKTAYVFLDAQDWMTDDQLNALWQEVTRTAAPDARVIFRTGGADDILPGRVDDKILSRWAYQPEASAKGFANDRSAIYGGFHVYHFKG